MANYLNSTLQDVKFHIDNADFDGPIDLLVKFVKESKIDVMEIFISDITSQYVNYVKNLKELNYEYVSQYIIFAALLIEIKSSKIAPQLSFDEDSSYMDGYDYSETENEIIAQVKEKLLNDCPEKLKPREVIYRFYPQPEYDESDYKLIAKNLSLDKLLDAYKLVLERVEIVDKAPQIQTIVKDRFTVSEKIIDITTKVRSGQKLSFFSLFEKDFTKTEMLTVFLAVLEIVKKQIVIATQSEFQSDIILEHNTADDTNNYEELLNDVDEYNWSINICSGKRCYI